MTRLNKVFATSTLVKIILAPTVALAMTAASLHCVSRWTKA